MENVPADEIQKLCSIRLKPAPLRSPGALTRASGRAGVQVESDPRVLYSKKLGRDPGRSTELSLHSEGPISPGAGILYSGGFE